MPPRWLRKGHSTRTWVLALGLAVAGACGGPRPLDPGPTGERDSAEARLLATVGFNDRSDWSSTLLHLEGDDIGTRASLTSLLRRVERVRFRRPEGSEWGLHLVDAEGRNPCPVAVYVNGSRYGRAERAGSQVSLDAIISGGAIAGLELHHGTEGPVLPVLECGTLLIWSPEADPVFGFLGDLTVVVEGAATEQVDSVVVRPGPIEGRRDGDATFFTVLPGAYEVLFMGADGPLDVRQVRVYAFAESEVLLEVN